MLEGPLSGSFALRESGNKEGSCIFTGRLDHSLPAICFFPSFFATRLIQHHLCSSALWMIPMWVFLCLHPLSLLLAIYHSWWPLEDGEERAVGPVDSLQCSNCGSSPSLVFVFLCHPLCQDSDCSPSRSQRNWGMQKVCRMGMKQDVRRTCFCLKLTLI